MVHGGARHAEPLRLDAAVLAALEQLVPMAPLHQPHNLAAVRVLMKLQPDLPQVACFDTAFHRTQPAMAQNFALPREITAAGVRRYGFHGLSYEYIAGVLPQHLGGRADGRVIVAHLGAGASLCAMRERRSVATTMGFTALEGLMMGTRSGSIDPGVLFYLMREQSMSPAAVEDLLYRRSGLLGVSGTSSDMRELLASRDAARAGSDRTVLLPGGAGNRLARGSPRRPRRAGLHRRHRRARGTGARRDLRAIRMAGRRTG